MTVRIVGLSARKHLLVKVPARPTNARQPRLESVKELVVIHFIWCGASCWGVAWRNQVAIFALLTVRTVGCHSYCVTQTRATRSQRAGTDAAGREDHVVDWRRERGDAIRRGSH